MKNLYVFIGKSGSGKTTIVNKLQEYGYSVVESYTTRPKRFKTEGGHQFISEQDFDNLSDICAYTMYDKYRYATTARDIDSKDLHILDVVGILSLMKNYKGKKNIKVIALKCSDNELISRMKSRGDSDEKIKSRVENDKIMFNGMYELADLIVDTENFSLSEVALKIQDWIEKTESSTPAPKDKFILLTDMDDVLENLIEKWIDLLNFFNKDNPQYVPKTPEDITDWNITRFFPMLTVDEVFYPLNTDIIWQLIKPLPGAVNALKKYNSMPDVEVRLATSSHYTAIHPKREFLRKNFPFLDWNQVIVIKDKQMLDGDVLVDDNPNNIIGGRYKGILFTSAHNKSFVCDNENIFRVKDWYEAEEKIDLLIDEFRKKVGGNIET